MSSSLRTVWVLLVVLAAVNAAVDATTPNGAPQIIEQQALESNPQEYSRKTSGSDGSGPALSTGGESRTDAFVSSACEAAFQGMRVKDEQLRSKDEQLRVKDEQIHELELEVRRLTKSPWAHTTSQMLAPRGPRDDVGDAASFAHTTQVVTPSKALKEMEQQCIDSAKGVALQEENELLQAGKKNKGKELDWTQCVSEGGKKDCAKCRNSDNGLLPCDKVEPSGGENKGRDSASHCPDGDMGSNGAYFVQFQTSGLGHCLHLKDEKDPIVHTGMVRTSYKFPGAKGDLVATKALVAHPNRADRSAGLFAFKRLVTHTCTGKRPEF